MRLLLDTHSFIWALTEPKKLTITARSAIEDPDNEAFVSAVTLWEIAIKTRINKLDLGGISNDDLTALAKKIGITSIALTPEEAETYGNLLENTHTDPFDRMLIWQAISRKMVLISKDSHFEKFVPDGLRLLWK